MAHPPRTPHKPRVVLVHDWLCGYRGGEAVLDRLAILCRRHVDLLGLLVMFNDHRSVTPAIDELTKRAASLSRLPGASGPLRRWLLPVYPAAVASLSRLLERIHRDQPIDLVISSSSSAVKGVRPPQGVPHLCYCHSPARYLWGRTAMYTSGGGLARARALGLNVFGARLRRWDRTTAARVTRFVANSSFIASEIRRCYARDSVVVHPPVRTDFFTPAPAVPREDFWLIAGALEPYKRVDLAIDAARVAGKRLVIAGAGSQEAPLRRRVQRHGLESRVEFTGRVPDPKLRDLYRRAELLIFPQVEDFGITAVEAQACGLPVLARRIGGAIDTVIPRVTGAFFDDPDAESIAKAAETVPRNADTACRRNAERFTEAIFEDAMLTQINEMLKR